MLLRHARRRSGAGAVAGTRTGPVQRHLERPTARRPAGTGSGPAEVLRAFLAELDRCAVPYAVLHGHRDLPDRIDSDVDFVVPPDVLRSIDRVVARVAGDHGWLVTQVRRHELTGCYVVAVDPHRPGHHLALDACSDFAKLGSRLVGCAELLAGRRRSAAGFSVPSAAGELAYVLAKAIAKDKDPAVVLPRLRQLAAEDPDGTDASFSRLTGHAGGSLARWLDDGAPGWSALREDVLARHRYRLPQRVRDGWRRAVRATRPTGIRVSLLGPDGSGKTTLLQALPAAVAGSFHAAPTVYKFRPDVTNRIVPGLDPTPHAREPRSRPVSVLKVLFYAADWWVGLPTRLLPAQRSGSLVLFDRDFADLAVDQRRYLVDGVGPLAALLRPLVPRSHATYVLDADPETVHRRKPELGVDELTRQRAAFRRLAARDRRIRLVDATLPPGEVLDRVAGDLTVLLARREAKRARPALTRVLDLLLAGGLLLVTAPLLAVVALAVRLRLGSPVLFRQERPGLLGQRFSMAKFRTMTDARDPATGRPLPDAQRVTRLGTFLRRTSLDELPELLNVVRGDMSLVGPRPLLMEYLPRYAHAEMRRHDVPPGVTGWAQVNGRNSASWPEKFALDLWYVDHRSLRVYLAVLARTIGVVLGRQGISQPGHVTGAKFTGSPGVEDSDFLGSAAGLGASDARRGGAVA